MSMETELAWAAGFFDGEGCTFLNRHKVTHYDRPNRPTNYVSSPTITIAQVDRRALDRFVAAVGVGKVSGPYVPRTPKSNPYFKCAIAGRDRVCAVLTKMWPYLGPVKRDQARAAWDREASFRTKKSPPMPNLPDVAEIRTNG